MFAFNIKILKKSFSNDVQTKVSQVGREICTRELWCHSRKH